jgi:hypothetical protein
MRFSCQDPAGLPTASIDNAASRRCGKRLHWCVTACFRALKRAALGVYWSYRETGNIIMNTSIRHGGGQHHVLGKIGIAVLLLIAASAAAAATTAAAANTKVSYVDTAKMTDVPRYASDRESMEIHFREHLEQLAEKLPAGQKLKVEFVDIDLAGDQFPRVAIQDVRVLKGRADWPRLHLRWSVEQDGNVVSSGDSKLADPNYLMSVNRYSNEMYGYEKEMLDDWFRKDVLKKER